MHCLTRIRFALVLRKMHFILVDKLHFCSICIVMLVQVTDHFSILNEGEPTFLAAYDSRVIDLCICYGPLFDWCKHTLNTVEFAKLFTVDPLTDLVPVIFRLEGYNDTENSKKIWIERADSLGWTCHWGPNTCYHGCWGRLCFSLERVQESASWSFLKCVSNHSKPFWNTDLTDASNELQYLLKKFKNESKFWERTKTGGSEGSVSNFYSTKMYLTGWRNICHPWAQKRKRVLDFLQNFDQH